jgi:segregation and condensation protein A
LKVTYKLEVFEGPLDLLLHLIDQSEVDIYNIPIKEITDQYMEYVQALQELELDVASDFLVMAATLLAIKSKMLLPKPPVIELDAEYGYEDDIDPRAELVQKLIEYRKYKSIAEMLREKEVERSLVYTREPEDLSGFIPDVQVNPVEGLFISDLILAFQRTLKRQVQRSAVARIRRDEISVKDRIRDVIELLRNKGGKVLFSKLFQDDYTREEIVVTFLAVLELMKMKKITCYQHALFDEIVIHAKGEVAEVELTGDEIRY